MHMYTDTHTHTHTHARTYTHIHTRTHTQTRTHSHTYTHTLTQGTHTAMLSGMYGGEAAFRSLTQEPQASQPGPRDMGSYESAIKVCVMCSVYVCG